MQPTIAQVIDSLEYSLRHDLIPELSTPWAQQTGERMLWALEHLRQRALHEHAHSVQENVELHELLKLIRQESSKKEGGPEKLDLEMLNDLPEQYKPWPQLEDLQEENDLLRRALDNVIESSPEGDVANPELPIWQAILDYLARQAEREAQLAAGDWPPPPS